MTLQLVQTSLYPLFPRLGPQKMSQREMNAPAFSESIVKRAAKEYFNAISTRYELQENQQALTGHYIYGALFTSFQSSQ